MGRRSAVVATALQIGHFCRLSIDLLMHKLQNKCPHFVEQISRPQKFSKPIEPSKTDGYLMRFWSQFHNDHGGLTANLT